MSEDVDLPEGWCLVRLSDYTTVKARLGWKGLKAEEYIEDGIIFLATPNLKANRIDFDHVNFISQWRYDESPEIQLQVGDVLIVKDGSTLGISNYVRYLPKPATVNGSIAVVRSRTSMNSEFLYHLVNGQDFQKLIELKKAGLGVPHLFQADLREFFVPLPPLPQQRKIARILTTLDNLIEKTEALIAKYQSIKQGMMHDLFTRGVDEQGHLRPPQSEAPELYKHSELGWIPKEWRVATIGKLFDKRTEHGKEGLPVMSVVMRDGLVERSSVDRRVESNLPPQSHALVLEGDIAYNMMRMWQGVMGRASFACLVSPAYVVLKPKDTIDTHFALSLFSDERSIQKFRQFSQGVVDDRLRLYFHDLVDIPFGLPTYLGEQQEIAKRLKACNRSVVTEKAALKQYQDLRASLMQDLLTGKVRVTPDEEDERV